MRLRYIALLLVAVPPALVILALMILATARRGDREECRMCGLRKVRPSWPAGMLERIGAHLGMIPYKCDGCLDRFYGWRERSS
jgi:hypothetical protein